MADIKLGASALGGFYIGSTAVDKVYLGDTEIFTTAAQLSNLYTFVNAVSDDDVDSDAGWSDTSTFFANSIASTDPSGADNYAIGIIARSTNASSTGSINHILPTLTVSTAYRMVIRYKMDYDAGTQPVQNPFFNWTNAGSTTYPTNFSNDGNFVDVEVLFTALSTTPTMRTYPHWNNTTGRTLNDTIEISSIYLMEADAGIEQHSGDASALDSEANSLGTWNNAYTLAVETTEVNSSTYSLRIQGSTGFRNSTLWIPSLANGDRVLVSFDAKCNIQSDQYASLKNCDNTQGFWAAGNQPLTWTRFARVVTVDDTLGDFGFFIEGSSGAGNASGDFLYIDNLSIKKLATASNSFNLVLNGTYDDSSNLTVPATWTVSGGVASYSRSGEDYFVHNTSEALNQGDTLRFTFDTSNSTDSGARIRFHLGPGGGEVIQDWTIYADGTHTFDYTITGALDNGTVFNVRGSSSGGGGSFDLDNLKVEKL